ncbi:nucleotidyltransferase domain-containing protein [Nanoarchaeota archaeon]
MEAILRGMMKKLDPGMSSMSKVIATVNQINKALDEHGINAECVVGGSFAKGTHLKGDHDVDLFVRFDYNKYHSQDISKILKNALPFKAETLPGSRDYFQFDKGNMSFEVVPVLYVDTYEDAKNVTDMSPLHATWFNRHVKKELGLNNEVRLAKQFCKANKVYGAESYIQGFSGHVMDILIIYYGSFEKLVKAASQWSSRVVIDVEHHLSNPLKQLNKSKIQSPLVLVDPLQPDRNAAAALSRDKFELFKSRCKEYLKNPSEDFFKPTKLEFYDLKKKAGNKYFVFLEAWPYKGKDDVMGAKLRQVHEHLFMKLNEQEWNILEADWEFVKAVKTRSKKKDLSKEPHGKLYFVISKKVLPYLERTGPPVQQHEDVKKFAKAHEHTYVRGGRLYAKVKRKYMNPEDYIDYLFTTKYIQERAKYAEFLED